MEKDFGPSPNTDDAIYIDIAHKYIDSTYTIEYSKGGKGSRTVERSLSCNLKVDKKKRRKIAPVEKGLLFSETRCISLR